MPPRTVVASPDPSGATTTSALTGVAAAPADWPDSLPLVSTAVTVYVTAVPTGAVESVNVVPVTRLGFTLAPDRYTLYPAVSPSALAAQFTVTALLRSTVPTPVGTA